MRRRQKSRRGMHLYLASMNGRCRVADIWCGTLENLSVPSPASYRLVLADEASLHGVRDPSSAPGRTRNGETNDEADFPSKAFSPIDIEFLPHFGKHPRASRGATKMLDREKTVSWPLLLVFPVVVSLSELFGVRTAFCEEQLPSFEFMKPAPDVFERTMDYMVTVSLALFGLVGYTFTILSSAVSCRVKIITYSSLLLFVLFDAMSLIFGYLSRDRWLISRLAVGQFDYE
jgi:hypothetical protein